ncbi:MAG TPA: RNA polymerase sigma factor [Pyrinomonadaceae bacterium]|jgi:RNA polymerase sigma-70 factor (ECF subfamily)|nr:RNA polymerase sigma factor [Pyrinomonadaceae bacterium]
MSDSEAGLIERAQAADAEAFAELAGRYERRIYSLALHYSHDAQDAEDLSQEAWLRAFRAINTFKGESSFYTWIRKITINCFLNHERTPFARLRSMLPQANQDPPRAIPHDSELLLHDRILVQKVMVALGQLTPRQRLIFILKHQEGMTYEEIARVVGCSTGTAKKAVARALVRVREQLHVTPEPKDCVPCAAGQY